MPDESVIQDPNRFPGERLIIARESKNMTQQSAADELHLPLRYIQWIEEAEFEKLPSLVFARGYIRSYAKLLGVDSASLIEAFDRFYGRSNNSAPMKSVSKVQEQVKLGDPMIKYSVWLFILALIAVTFWWWKTQYGLTLDSITTKPDQSISVETADGNTLVLPKFNDAEVTEETPPVESTEQEPEYLSDDQIATLQTELDAAAPAVVTEPVEDAVDSSVVVTPAPLVQESPVNNSTETELTKDQGVYIAFNSDCWVTIKDANGRTLFNNVRKAGESLNVDGPTPISLIIGRQSSVSEITYNGVAIDLVPFGNKNVAKLSLPLN